jgi:hypothetical protein
MIIPVMKIVVVFSARASQKYEFLLLNINILLSNLVFSQGLYFQLCIKIRYSYKKSFLRKVSYSASLTIHVYTCIIQEALVLIKYWHFFFTDRITMYFRIYGLQ